MLVGLATETRTRRKQPNTSMNSLFWPIRPEHRPWSASSRNSTIKPEDIRRDRKLDEIRQYVGGPRNRIGDIRRRTVVKAGNQYREGAQGEDSYPNKPDSRHLRQACADRHGKDSEWNSPNISICFPDSPGCGLTSNGSGEVSV